MAHGTRATWAIFIICDLHAWLMLLIVFSNVSSAILEGLTFPQPLRRASARPKRQAIFDLSGQFEIIHTLQSGGSTSHWSTSPTIIVGLQYCQKRLATPTPGSTPHSLTPKRGATYLLFPYFLYFYRD